MYCINELPVRASQISPFGNTHVPTPRTLPPIFDTPLHYIMPSRSFIGPYTNCNKHGSCVHRSWGQALALVAISKPCLPNCSQSIMKMELQRSLGLYIGPD